MTRREAQEILLSYRPGAEPADDRQVAAALELARTDAELREWYEQHRAWDAAMRQKLNALPVPPDLKYSILAGKKVVSGPAHWWNRRAALLAAAAMIALLTALAVMIARRPDAPVDTFAKFRRQIIGAVLREYRMDLQTNDLQQVRSYLAGQGAPADYVVPARLQNLKLEGCGKLAWQGKPVSMLCYEDPQNRLVWLFVAQAGNWQDRPPTQPTFERVVTCETVSWSEGNLVYVLASETSASALRKLL